MADWRDLIVKDQSNLTNGVNISTDHGESCNAGLLSIEEPYKNEGFALVIKGGEDASDFRYVRLKADQATALAYALLQRVGKQREFEGE